MKVAFIISKLHTKLIACGQNQTWWAIFESYMHSWTLSLMVPYKGLDIANSCNEGFATLRTSSYPKMINVSDQDMSYDDYLNC